jgi:Tfp pilus assembly major pilin PilA
MIVCSDRWIPAVAVPAYQNYTVRAITEGLSLASAAKTAVLEDVQNAQPLQIVG